MVGCASILNMEVMGRAPPGAPVCELIKGGREEPTPPREGEDPTLVSALVKNPLGNACERNFD